jgi:ATP-dependent Clp protease protease subunit
MAFPLRLLLPSIGTVAGVMICGSVLGCVPKATTGLPSADWFQQSHLYGISEPEEIHWDDPFLKERKVFIFDYLGPELSENIVLKLLYLARQDEKRPIDLFLRTIGGYFDDAFAIYDAIQMIKAPVNIWVIGGCWSGGTLILQGATGKRYCTPNAFIGIHINKPRQTNEYNDLSNNYEHRVTKILREKAKLPVEWFYKDGDNTYSLTDQQALTFQLVDEIRTSP